MKKISNLIFFISFLFTQQSLGLSNLDHSCAQRSGNIRTESTPAPLTPAEIQRFGVWMTAAAILSELQGIGTLYDREATMSLIPRRTYFNYIQATNCDRGLFQEFDAERRRLIARKNELSTEMYRAHLLTRLDEVSEDYHYNFRALLTGVDPATSLPEPNGEVSNQEPATQ